MELDLILQATIGRQPPITKIILLTSTSLMVLCSLDIISSFHLYLNWHSVLYQGEVWRLLTCFVFFGCFLFDASIQET